MGAAEGTRRPAPQTRAERRRRAQARRNRLFLVVGVVVSVAVMGAWFPVSGLLHQRQQLAAASSQLHQLHGENQALSHRETQLETPAAVGRIAQQQYNLVTPGEQAYQVLPPASANGDGTLTTPTAASGAPGSPGSAGAGAPAGNIARTGKQGRSREAASSRTSSTSGGFLARVVQTLEFWR